MKKHISIVLVNYNTPDETKACLRSLSKIKHSGFNFQVIVVDNGSKESLLLSKKFLETMKNVDLVRSETNLGFSGGSNLGIQYALDHYDSDFFLLLNTDTIVDENFLQELYDVASNNSQVGLVVPKIYFHKGYEFWASDYQGKKLGQVIWYAGGVFDWKNLFAFHVGVDELDRGQFESSSETDFVTGCCMLISREVIERVGLIDDSYFLYLEDVDYSMRVKAARLKLIFAPKAKVWHKISSSTGGSGSKLQLYYQSRNRLYLAFKYGKGRQYLTALHLLYNFLLKGESIERKAVLDLLLGRMGKQPYI